MRFAVATEHHLGQYGRRSLQVASAIRCGLSSGDVGHTALGTTNIGRRVSTGQLLSMTEANRIRTVLADDHPAFRLGLRHILEADRDVVIVGEAENGMQALRLVEEHQPDVLLLDVLMPELDGIEVLERLSLQHLPVYTILVTEGIERQQALQALQLGARGIIVKTAHPATYAKAIRRVRSGELWVERQVLAEWALTNAQSSDKYGLTRRELEIVREISFGSSNKQIAAKFNVSEPTVKSHLTNIFDKLGVRSRFELSTFALHHHLLR